MWLSILLGESEPWLLGAVVCTVTLLIVSLAILRSNKWRKDACPKSEEQKISTPPQRVDLPIDVNVEEEDHSTASSESETELVTTYCSNGCQGACACPALELDLEFLRKNEPTLIPVPPEIPSQPDIPVSKPDSRSNLRKKSTDKSKLTLQYFKDKFHRESFDAGSEPTGSELHGSECTRSESPKSERKRSRFAEWRRRSLGSGSSKQVNKTEQGSSSEVSQASSKHKTDSLKVLRGMLSFKKTTSADGVAINLH